ncbi:hypothetical protein [Fodinibius sediminis]|nr:hypothetical protein [Fodinibius sediminis]
MTPQIKSVIAFVVLLILSSIAGPLKAQAELKAEQVPTEIVKSIQTDFPCWDITKTKWYSYGMRTRGWAPINKAEVDHYVVEVSGKNYRVHAVYEKDGKLRYSKMTISDAPIPRAILDKIASEKEYKGWKVTGDQEIIRNFREDQKIYHVHLERDGDKKRPSS